jgi:uncharacterized protein (DUF4213/DUF364 family)
MLADQIRNYLREQSGQRVVRELRIGLTYTGVLLDDGCAGVAFTFKDNLPAGCSIFGGSHPLAGSPAHEIVRYIGSSVWVESSVGVATANALINREKGTEQEGDVLDTLELGKGDRVGMVGFFGPLVGPIRKKVKELTIFERTARAAKGLLPTEKAPKELPKCDVALITSTSLINGTMDSLIEASQKCREIVLLGASTPLLPEVFRPLGVSMLSGIIITDPTSIFQIISEGGGMRFFKHHIQKVNMRI